MVARTTVIDRRYPANVFWSEEDEGFIALAPDLPGCSAFGESEAEALDELRQAIDAWIEAARAAGNPVPEPTPLPRPALRHA
jgi:predicted RNase H-like HicB family nuclease